jgi:hypothetical protein
MTNPNDPNSATAQLLAATQTNTALAVSSTQGNAKLEVGRWGRGPAAAALEYPMVGTAILRDPKLSDTASPFVAELRSKIVTTDESINTEFPELAQFPTMAGKLAAMQTALKEWIEARVVASLKPIEWKYTLPKDKLPREDQRQKYQASSHILWAQNLQKDLTDLWLWDTVKYVITWLDMGLDATDVLKAQQLLVADLGKIEEYMTKEQARMTKLVGLYNTFSNSLYERANKQYPNTPAITSTSITLPTADLSWVKAIAQKTPPSSCRMTYGINETTWRNSGKKCSGIDPRDHYGSYHSQYHTPSRASLLRMAKFSKKGKRTTSCARDRMGRTS